MEGPKEPKSVEELEQETLERMQETLAAIERMREALEAEKQRLVELLARRRPGSGRG